MSFVEILESLGGTISTGMTVALCIMRQGAFAGATTKRSDDLSDAIACP
jgi:hypothetical protein